MPTADDIGVRGESIFVTRITSPCGPYGEPLFRPHFLGEKFATLDYLLELVGMKVGAAYCFVQVKATRLDLTRGRPHRLRVQLPRIDVERMIRYPAPTYLVGIHEPTEVAYIASVNEADCGPFASLRTDHSLNDPANLQRLWDEVLQYWRSRDMVLRGSVFKL